MLQLIFGESTFMVYYFSTVSTSINVYYFYKNHKIFTKLTIYIYYLFVSQPLPLLSPAAASQFEGVGENQWERVCVLELWPETGHVAESQYSGHSPPFTLIERLNQPHHRHSHTDMTPVLASDWSVKPSLSLWLTNLGQFSPPWLSLDWAVVTILRVKTINLEMQKKYLMFKWWSLNIKEGLYDCPSERNKSLVY